MKQKILTANGNNYSILDSWFENIKSIMLVCGNSIEKQKISEYFNAIPAKFTCKIIRFSNFAPNPTYKSILEGVKVFRKEQCNGIIAVGGGSAIDVAKCIKLYSNMKGNGENGSFLNQQVIPDSNLIPFLAIPTTAGTGSEATKYAVIYYNHEKQSITHESCIPDTVLLDASLLKSLPEYQRKVTMCDALCHAIESFWSINSTNESKEYSKQALEGILKHMEGYLNNTDEGNAGMLMAANTAGKAINITQTTAGHAMSYKITSQYGIAHGHSVALCLREIWPAMNNKLKRNCEEADHTNSCIDSRGVAYLRDTFEKIASAMDCTSSEQAAWKLNEIFLSLNLDVPNINFNEAKKLAVEVNPDRLKNNPIELKTIPDLASIYANALNNKNAIIDKLLVYVSEALKSYFKQKAIHFDKEALPDRLILDFMDNRNRWLPIKVYNIKLSQELAAKIKYKAFIDQTKNQVSTDKANEIIAAFNHIKDKAEKGENINFNQSKGIFLSDQDKKDTLLNSWGVRHIHLSEIDATSKSGMKRNRSGYLLFFIVHNNDILCLDIRNHPTTDEGFICYDFLKIMSSNGWMTTTGLRKVPGYIAGSISLKITKDEDLAALYFNGINVSFEFDGNLYFPINSMTTTRDNTDNVLYFQKRKKDLRKLLHANDIVNIKNVSVDTNERINCDFEIIRCGCTSLISFTL